MNHLFLPPCFSTFSWWPESSSPFAIKFTHFSFILSQLQYNSKLLSRDHKAMTPIAHAALHGSYDVMVCLFDYCEFIWKFQFIMRVNFVFTVAILWYAQIIHCPRRSCSNRLSGILMKKKLVPQVDFKVFLMTKLVLSFLSLVSLFHCLV